RVVPTNYDPKGERFLIASRFPSLPLACAFFIPRATVKQVIIGLSSLSCGVDLRDGIFPLCNSRNSCVHDSDPNSFDCPPDSYNHPHPTYETYLGDSCGNDPQCGYDCPPQFPLNYEPEPGYSQNYDSNSFGFDQIQTPQYTIMEQMTQLTSICEMTCQIAQKKLEEKQIEEEQAVKAQNRKLPVCYDDDDDEKESNSLKDNNISELPPCSAVTPSEPIDSLSMGDEHLDTIPATESDELIKSCVENLVPNPKIISIKKNQHHFNAESDLVESMLNRDSSIVSPSSKIDSLLDEFAS
nr:hypothetical protein [Tanacetum cinerariifolium]